MRRIELLRGFRLIADGDEISVPMGPRRLLALVALRDRPLQRSFVAGTLWPDSSENNAASSLRSALWRVRSLDETLLTTADGTIRLSSDIDTDVRSLVRIARGEMTAPFSQRLDGLSGDLLPDWYEDWVELEREMLRQLRMHALEDLAVEMCEAGRFVEALEAGYASMRCEPLRESAHRVLIRIHLAEGNLVEARRQYDYFSTLLYQELGLRPSAHMEKLIAPAHGETSGLIRT